MTETFNAVRNILVEHLVADTDTITLETSFADLGADSLDTMEIVLEIEDHFGLEVSDDDAESFTKVGDIVSYIESQKAAEVA